MSEPLTLQASLVALLSRDLQALCRTIEAYPDDQLPWRQVPGVPNTGGTLALHVAGNLRHFIGAALGGTGYVRDREREFSAEGVPRTELVAGLAIAETEVRQALGSLTPIQLAQEYPLPLAGHRFVTSDLLLHLATHLAFHLGQADTHRRMVTGNSVSIGPTALPALASARPADA